jgi:hypothetical protein
MVRLAQMTGGCRASSLLTFDLFREEMLASLACIILPPSLLRLGLAGRGPAEHGCDHQHFSGALRAGPSPSHSWCCRPRSLGAVPPTCPSAFCCKRWYWWPSTR